MVERVASLSSRLADVTSFPAITVGGGSGLATSIAAVASLLGFLPPRDVLIAFVATS